MADLIAAPPIEADLRELAERAMEARRRIVAAVGRVADRVCAWADERNT